MTSKLLLDIAENRPENLLLAGTEALWRFARFRGQAPDLRCTVLAELAARWCLSLDDGLNRGLADMLGDSWRRFSNWYRVARPWENIYSEEEFGNWGIDPAPLAGFLAILKCRLERLFVADGFIPVASSVGAWFIPFELDKTVQGARWGDGSAIPEWEGPVRTALAETGFAGLRIQLCPGPEIVESVTGASLMLPVRMAAKRGSELPKYDRLRVLATGEFGLEFKLEDVKIRPKLEAMKRQFADAVMIGPDVPGEIDRGEKAFCRLACGLEEREVFRQIRDLVEQMPGCVRMTCAYAIGRLQDMSARVDRENRRRWNDVAIQLERMKDAVSARRKPEIRLEFAALLATALCHAGRTEESRQCTREALEFAREHGYEAKALRLQVMAAVNAQDLGAIDELMALADDIGANLAAYTGPEKTDLLMRYHGTLAQANAFGAVFGLSGCSPSAAVGHCEQAIKAACALAEASPPELRDEAESNLARDLNYRHLMAALFEPGSAAEAKAYAEARQQLSELAPASAKNNRYHQMRQKSLALLNGWRLGASVPDADTCKALRIPLDDAEGWLVAANRRHLGTLAAAVGDGQEAERCFREGDEALPFGNCQSPILAAIRLALLVQAALALATCGKAEEAAKYASLATEAYDGFGESRLFKTIHMAEWMAALRDNSSPRALPAFYY